MTALRPAGWFVGAAGVLIGAASVPTLAAAQAKPVEAPIVTTVGASSNGALAASGAEQRDAYLSLRPSLNIGHIGPGLRVRGDLGVDLVKYKNGTRDDGALPFAQANVEATLAERLLFVDAALDVRQIETDPFAARVEQGSSQNSRTETKFKVSPFVSSEWSPDISFLGRADVFLTRYEADPGRDSRSGELTLRVVAKPRPFGGLVELTDQKVEYPNVSANDWRVDTATLGPNVSIDNDFVVGALLGAERTTTTLSTNTDPVVGVNALWFPNQRTRLSINASHRYFGNAWDLVLRHRTASVSVSLRAIKEPLVPGISTVGAGGNLATFLDSILTTRYPDPAQRRKLVSDTIAVRGLQTAIKGTAGAVANYAQLGQGAEVTAVWLGARNALSIAIYQQSVRLLARSDGASSFVGSGDEDNRQIGVNVGLNRRLSPETSIDLTVGWSRVEGLGVRSGDLTRESSYRLTLARNLAPRTALNFGAQYRQLESNVAGQAAFDEASAFVAVGHRF